MNQYDYYKEQIDRNEKLKGKLTDDQLQKYLKDDYVKRMYKKSLENEYYDTMVKMMQLPDNFKRLLSPVGKANLDNVAKDIIQLIGDEADLAKNKLINRNYLTKLRQSFVMGKKWVGIAAVNITGHSLAQRAGTYIDPERFVYMPALDKVLLGDGSIVLPHNTIKIDGKEYQDGAKIEVTKSVKDDQVIPVGLHFENKDGDFKNDYRFMNQAVINEKLKTFTFKGVKWDVEVEPTVSGIQRFQFQAGANTEHTTFLAKTDGNKLKFTFGDASSHGGEFVFATDVVGNLNKGWTWPVLPVLSILKIADANNTKMSFSNEGAMQIMLDSGIAIYKYIIPAQS
jgi:hypothetical protein